MAPDVHQRSDLAFPRSLPEFQSLFPNDAACAAYLARIRWEDGFTCPHCGTAAEPYRFEARPGVLRCRACKRDVALTAGTVMERTHTPWRTLRRPTAKATAQAEATRGWHDARDAFVSISAT